MRRMTSIGVERTTKRVFEQAKESLENRLRVRINANEALRTICLEWELTEAERAYKAEAERTA